MTSTERNRRIVENLPLVGFLVSEVWGRATHLSRDDLAAAGALALVTAADAFDPARGVPFGAFARRRILGAFADEMRSMDWATRGARERIKSTAHTQERLAAALGRAATVDEIAEAMGVQRSAVTEALSDAGRTVQPLDDLVADRLSAEVEAPGESLLVEERLRYLRAAVESLPDRQRRIVERIYFDGESVSEVARELGVTHSAVSQQRTAAVRLLREGLEAHYEDSGAAEGRGAPESRRMDYIERMAQHPLLRAQRQVSSAV